MAAVMRTIVVREFGGIKKMKVETDFPVPSVGDHEVCTHSTRLGTKETIIFRLTQIFINMENIKFSYTKIIFHANFAIVMYTYVYIHK